MKFKTRWMGRICSRDEIKPGSLFVVSSGGECYLAVRVTGGAASSYGMVLREYQTGGNDPVPRLVTFEVLADSSADLRLIDDVIFEPVPDAAGDLSNDTATPLAVGSLALMREGDVGIYFRAKESSIPGLFRMKDGALASPEQRRDAQYFRRWRLLWLDGDDELELLRFGG